MAMMDEAIRGRAFDSRDRSLKGRIKEILPWKGDDFREILRKLIFIVAVCVLCSSAYDAYIYNFGSEKMINDQQDLSNLYHHGAVTTPANPAEPNNPVEPIDPASPVPENPSPDDELTTPEPAPDSKYPAGMNANFNDLYDINPDVVGFLYINGIYLDDDVPEEQRELAIDYPVVQTVDNDKYLEYDFTGAKAEYGAIFADYSAKVFGSDRSSNVTLYGHNMKVGRFFHHLHDYKKGATFVSEHRIINFDTLFDEGEYVVVACFLVSVNEKDDNQPIFRYHLIHDFADDAEFDYWYKNVLYRNYYITDIDCDINDEYLSLSTCSTEINDSRFVVVARKVRPGEDPSVYKYRSNSKAHKPAKLYIATGNPVPEDDGPDYEVYPPQP